MDLGANEDQAGAHGALRKAGDAWMLPDDLGAGSAGGLQASLLALRGSACDLDASAVRRLGGLSLQVLMAAAAAWAADGGLLRVVDPSPAFQDALRQFGVAATTLTPQQEPQS